MTNPEINTEVIDGKVARTARHSHNGELIEFGYELRDDLSQEQINNADEGLIIAVQLACEELPRD